MVILIKILTGFCTGNEIRVRNGFSIKKNFNLKGKKILELKDIIHNSYQSAFNYEPGKRKTGGNIISIS
jgi:hypothetical protein